MSQFAFKRTIGDAVFNKAKIITTLGNRAVHDHRAVPVDDAVVATRKLSSVLLARIDAARV